MTSATATRLYWSVVALWLHLSIVAMRLAYRRHPDDSFYLSRR